MRVLIFHGYLLHGTGSNVYNANLAAALVRLGHEVHLLCQDRAPDELPFVDAVGDWDAGQLAVRALREPVRCTVYRPALAGLLPVYVADRYEGIEARPYPDCSDAEVEAYVEANVRAVRDIVARVRPDVALANHLVMGPLIFARALPEDVPYAVKVHGSDIEYTVAPHPERFVPPAREGVARASGLLVGSGHIADRLVGTLDDETLRARIRLGPPGVDVARFAPRAPDEAHAGLRALADRLAAQEAAPAGEEGARSAFARDVGEAATALADVARGLGDDPATDRAQAAGDPRAIGRDRLVAFVGKLIVSKGIDLLLAAWPLVLQREPRARLVVVGFGAYRGAVERMCGALADGDLRALDALVAAGRAEEGGPRAPLRLLRAFLDGLRGAERGAYFAAAAGLRERVVLTGRLDHDELADLLPACEALVVPSTFPEAFGMVAAEGAACGALPVCARHSGLAEVAEALAQAVPPPARPWLAFGVTGAAGHARGKACETAAGEAGGNPVVAIAEHVCAWLGAPATLRDEVRTALAATVRERWSWEGVARGVIAAAQLNADAGARERSPGELPLR